MKLITLLFTTGMFIFGCGGEEEPPVTNPPVDTGVDITEGYTTPMSYADMTLVWNDEFSGTSLNLNDWAYDIGTGCPNLCGWGNNELEYYREQNVSVGDGVLTLQAKRETFEESDYTSGKIVTRHKQLFQYGRIDIRALLPDGGQGLWPALWLLGDNQPTVGWPKCGEIDIMEMTGGGGKENRITGNVFWDENGTADTPSAYTKSGKDFTEEYHVFSIIWEEDQIEWFVNDEKYKTFNTNGAAKDEFRLPFYMIMNVAVGGNFPGNPDASSRFPTEMKVDYVRFFQNN